MTASAMAEGYWNTIAGVTALARPGPLKSTEAGSSDEIKGRQGHGQMS